MTLNYIIWVFFWFSFTTNIFAQNYYYIHPKTGIRERLHWTPTPIGTYATYKTDYETGEAKKIEYLGDPLKQYATTIFLPNYGKAILTEKGDDIEIKFASGKKRIYKSRQCWVDTTNKPFVDYIAFDRVYQKEEDIDIYFRGLGLRKEVKCIILAEDKIEGTYQIVIPNMEGIYQIISKEDMILIHPNGKKQIFIYELY